MSQDFIHLCWNPNPPRQRMADIIARVAEKHGVSISDIKGPSRLRMYAHPRQEAMSEMVDMGYAEGRVPATGAAADDLYAVMVARGTINLGATDDLTVELTVDQN